MKAKFDAAGSNFTFYIITMWSVIKMILDLRNALMTLNLYGESFEIHFTLLQMNIVSKSWVYHVGYYFLIPVSVGIVYNIVVMIKNRKRDNMKTDHVNY